MPTPLLLCLKQQVWNKIIMTILTPNQKITKNNNKKTTIVEKTQSQATASSDDNDKDENENNDNNSFLGAIMDVQMILLFYRSIDQ